MIIGTVSENKELEKRISITPEIAKKYILNGFEVMIEKDLASHLGISDKEFLDEGCKIDSRENVLNHANIILQLNLPDEKSTNLLKEDKILIGNFNSSSNKEVIANISNKKIKLMFLWSILIGYSRIYLGVHFFLDVIFGFLVGYLTSNFIYRISKKFKLF